MAATEETAYYSSDKAVFGTFFSVFKPVEPLTVSEWADRYRVLTSKASAEPGKWRTDRAPYQREIMDAFTDPMVEEICVMSSAQVGKTEIILNAIGYAIDYDPASIMVIQPNSDPMAETFSKDRLSPMIQECPTLRDKVGDAKSRNTGNTILHKEFPGGHVTIVGANSPSGLASRPIRYLHCDEVDRYPESAGAEGDPIKLAVKRTTSFWNRKILYTSTPTIKGVSRIEDIYEQSSKGQWTLSCPHCGHYQPLKWGALKFDTMTMECEECRGHATETEWKMQHGKWIHEYPERKIRGFHLNEMASPWKRWDEMVSDFREAKAAAAVGDKEKLKVFINTSLGETWEEQGESVDNDYLEKRREYYDAELPEGVLVLVAGADTNDDRIEVEVVGFGVGEESWGIEYKVFYGDPGQDAVWQQFDEYLSRTWERADGASLGIACTCVDSGGHFTQEVYSFTKPREHRRIFAVKGRAGIGVPIIGKATRNNRKNAALFPVGDDAGKELILSRLKVEFEGPGYCHFPREQERGYDPTYFKGLTSEKRVIKFHKGRSSIEWVKAKGTRNEPLDCRKYALAALRILNPNFELISANPNRGAMFTQGKQMTGAPKRRRILSKGVQ